MRYDPRTVTRVARVRSRSVSGARTNARLRNSGSRVIWKAANELQHIAILQRLARRPAYRISVPPLNGISMIETPSLAHRGDVRGGQNQSNFRTSLSGESAAILAAGSWDSPSHSGGIVPQ